jgi:hypothetical protein
VVRGRREFGGERSSRNLEEDTSQDIVVPGVYAVPVTGYKSGYE